MINYRIDNNHCYLIRHRVHCLSYMRNNKPKCNVRIPASLKMNKRGRDNLARINYLKDRNFRSNNCIPVKRTPPYRLWIFYRRLSYSAVYIVAQI